MLEKGRCAKRDGWKCLTDPDAVTGRTSCFFISLIRKQAHWIHTLSLIFYVEVLVLNGYLSEAGNFGSSGIPAKVLFCFACLLNFIKYVAGILDISQPATTTVVWDQTQLRYSVYKIRYTLKEKKIVLFPFSNLLWVKHLSKSCIEYSWKASRGAPFNRAVTFPLMSFWNLFLLREIYPLEITKRSARSRSGECDGRLITSRLARKRCHKAEWVGEFSWERKKETTCLSVEIAASF